MPHAIVRLPAPSLASDCALTHIARTPIDFARIAAQHAAYREALRAAGCVLDVLPALPAFPDSVFVEDAAVALPGRVVLTRPGTPSREPEPRFLCDTLAGHGLEIAQIEPPATLDGGDVLRIGRRLYVGASSRTNPAGIAAIAEWAWRDSLEVVAVPIGPSLHLKTAVTALDDDTVVANPAWVDPTAFAVARVIEVDPQEPFAANVLRIDTTLLVNRAFPRTLERLEAHARSGGLRVMPVDIAEFGKAEAGLTCLSLILESGDQPAKGL
jgi:dimethylargininase